MEHHPQEMLMQLRVSLEKGRFPPASVVEWWLDGARKYRQGIDLDWALGLTGPLAVKARDESLRRAAEILAPHKLPRKQARILAQHIKHFENEIYPSIKKHPGQRIIGWKYELTMAWLTGCKIPKTARHLAQILKEKFPY